jgi:hypothetical protein
VVFKAINGLILEAFFFYINNLVWSAPNSKTRLRQTAGYSQRMISYYEKETDYPPTHLLPLLAKTLAVSADLLLGLETVNVTGPPFIMPLL